MVHMGGPPQLRGERRDDLLHERGDPHGHVRGRRRGLLIHDPDLFGERLRVVRADLRAEPVLQGRYDPAAVRVVVGVGRRHQEQVERQADPVAADLDVALLEDVEEAHLDPLGQVRELVDRHDAPMRAGDHAVVDRELVPEVAALGHLDRVDVPDQVPDGGVGCGELLRVAILAWQPAHRDGFALAGHELAAAGADGAIGMVVDLAPLDDRNLVIEEFDHRPHEAGLGLATLPEQDQVVAGQDAALHRRQHGVVEPNEAGEEIGSGFQAGEEVLAELLLHGAIGVARGPELADGAGWFGHDDQPSQVPG